MIGIWIEIENKAYEDINNDLFIPTIMMMSVGFIIIINSVVGLSGVLKENAALLRLVSIHVIYILFHQFYKGKYSLLLWMM